MSLNIATLRPQAILGQGQHAGFEWMVIHNMMGYRCGYIKVPEGHPWYGKDYDAIKASVHGGLKFSEYGMRDGMRDGYWVGFDCAHAWDAPDPVLVAKANYKYHLDYSIREPDIVVRNLEYVQEYVEAECRSLCEQAHAATEHPTKGSEA